MPDTLINAILYMRSAVLEQVSDAYLTLTLGEYWFDSLRACDVMRWPGSSGAHELFGMEVKLNRSSPYAIEIEAQPKPPRNIYRG